MNKDFSKGAVWKITLSQAVPFMLIQRSLIPLTLILPHLGMDVNGVFIAEPVSNAVGGLACYITMRKTIYNKLNEEELT